MGNELGYKFKDKVWVLVISRPKLLLERLRVHTIYIQEQPEPYDSNHNLTIATNPCNSNQNLIIATKTLQ